MEFLTRFGQTLLDNIVFMMVMLPLVGACLVMTSAGFGIESIRRTALTNVVLSLLLAIAMVTHYNPLKRTATGKPELMQMVSHNLIWLGSEHRNPADKSNSRPAVTGLNVRCAVGVDGISLWLVALSVLLTFAAVLSSWGNDSERPAAFYALLLLLESALIGVFAALDVVLFYVCLEFAVLVLFFLVSGWGGSNRRHVGMTFALYNLAGSLLILLGLIGLVTSYAWMQSLQPGGNPRLVFGIGEMTHGLRSLTGDGSVSQQYWLYARPWIFLVLVAGFAIRIPLVPFHTWFATANVEARSTVSVLLSGVVLKIGCYGLLRFVVPIFPGICPEAFGFLSPVVVAGVVFAAFIALAQDNLRSLVSFASISHMGICVLGITTLNLVGVTGGLLHLVNHGLSVAVLLLIVGIIHTRSGRQSWQSNDAASKRRPLLKWFLAIAVLSLIGVPGLNGFASETLLLLGLFDSNPAHAVWVLGANVLLAWAFLSVTQRVLMAGPSGVFADLSGRQLAMLLPLVILIVWIGVAPHFFVARIEPSILELLSAYSSQ